MKRYSVIIALLLTPCFLKGQLLTATDHLTLYQVSMKDFSLRDHSKTEVVFESTRSKKVIKGISNESGTFSVLLPEGEEFLVKVNDLSGKVYYDRLEVPRLKGARTEHFDIVYNPPFKFEIEDVEFTKENTITSTSYEILDDMARVMMENEDLFIEISGHTDNTHNHSYSLINSTKRAQAIRKYLMSKEISEERMVAVGYGFTKPVYKNITAMGRKKNERVEVRVLNR